MSSSPTEPRHGVDPSRVEIVVAHEERVTLRVGDMFLKIDSEPANLEVEVEAMRLAPVPTPTVLWRQPSVLALAAVPGDELGVLGEPSPASAAAWAAAGAAARLLHETPPPPWRGRSLVGIEARLDSECALLIESGLVPAELVTRNRELAQLALEPAPTVFMHGDLQLRHVFVVGDEVSGVIDWSEAGQGDAHYDLAVLTLGHEEHLDDVIAGYGGDVDRERIRAWWSLRSLIAVRWLAEHGFDPGQPGAEIDVLRAAL